jgi:uncharacterized protein (TIGR03067 family)
MVLVPSIYVDLFFTLLVALAGDDLTAKDLQGTWKGERWTEGTGGGQGGEVVEFTFKDNVLVGRKKSGVVIGEATFALTEGGKNIDATGTSGGYRNKTYPGIIKVEGDKLTWCSAGGGGKDMKRPGSFAANPGSAHYLIILTRQK